MLQYQSGNARHSFDQVVEMEGLYMVCCVDTISVRAELEVLANNARSSSELNEGDGLLYPLF